MPHTKALSLAALLTAAVLASACSKRDETPPAAAPAPATMPDPAPAPPPPMPAPEPASTPMDPASAVPAVPPASAASGG